MKKLLFLFSIFAITLSCSSDDSADINPLMGTYAISNVNWNTSDFELQNALEILKNNSANIIISKNGLGIIDVYSNKAFNISKGGGVKSSFVIRINGSFNILDKTSENEYLVDVEYTIPWLVNESSQLGGVIKALILIDVSFKGSASREENWGIGLHSSSTEQDKTREKIPINKNSFFITVRFGNTNILIYDKNNNIIRLRIFNLCKMN